ERRPGFGGIALEDQRQPVPAVEAGLLGANRPSAGPRGFGEHRLEPRAELLHASGAEQREVAGSLAGREALDPVDQLEELALRERRGVERERIAAGIAQIPLHPHGAQQEEAEPEL